MSRAKGTPNKPKEALDPGLANLATIALDMNLDESVRQEAAQALQDALASPAPEPATHPEPTDPFAGCGEWPPAGHKTCIYDGTGNYHDCDVQGYVPCLVEPLRQHDLPFGRARAIDLDALDRLEKELGL